MSGCLTLPIGQCTGRRLWLQWGGDTVPTRPALLRPWISPAAAVTRNHDPGLQEQDSHLIPSGGSEGNPSVSASATTWPSPLCVSGPRSPPLSLIKGPGFRGPLSPTIFSHLQRPDPNKAPRSQVLGSSFSISLGSTAQPVTKPRLQRGLSRAQSWRRMWTDR